MKKTIYILAVAFGVWNCSNRTPEKKENKNVVDALQAVSVNEQQQETIINTSQYDSLFINGLSEYKEPITLIENYILIGQDTVYFPEDLQLNKETVFKGTKDLKNFSLSVTRINLTSLNYNFQLSDKDAKTINSKSGKATLDSLFFLGSETDDDETGDEYLSVEYFDNSPDCTFAIRIGEKDDKGKLRAKIKLSCNDHQSKNIDLNDNPTLRTQ